jgi:hypothetical protein
VEGWYDGQVGWEGRHFLLSSRSVSNNKINRNILGITLRTKGTVYLKKFLYQTTAIFYNKDTRTCRQYYIHSISESYLYDFNWNTAHKRSINSEYVCPAPRSLMYILAARKRHIRWSHRTASAAGRHFKSDLWIIRSHSHGFSLPSIR